MAARIAITALLFLLPPLVSPYHIGFAQKSTPPSIIRVDRNHWFNCFKLPSPKEPLLGLAIYNAASQTHFPDGIQFYIDPTGRCSGEPSLVLAFSKRVGVYFVNLEALGLSKVFTCWRYYDLQKNPLGLRARQNMIRRGYEEGPMDNMAFKTKVFPKEWIMAKMLKDVPKPAIFVSQGGQRYNPEYILEYGTPPEGGRSNEKELVLPYLERQLKRWSKIPVGDEEEEQRQEVARGGEDVVEEVILEPPSPEIIEVLENQNIPPLTQQEIVIEDDNPIPEPKKIVIEDNMPPPRGDGMGRGYTLGSFEHLRRLAEQPVKPKTGLTVTQRMYEILRQNAQKKLTIPSPASAFGLTSLKQGLTTPELIDEVGRLTADPDSSNIELGWTLVRLATQRDMSLFRQEGGGVDNFRLPIQTGPGQRITAGLGTRPITAAKTARDGNKESVALLDLSDLSEVDASPELKVTQDLGILPAPIARDVGPTGAAPPQRGPVGNDPILVDSDDEEIIEPYGRRRQPQSVSASVSSPLQAQARVGGRMEEEAIEIDDNVKPEVSTGNQENWEEALQGVNLDVLEKFDDSFPSQQAIFPQNVADFMRSLYHTGASGAIEDLEDLNFIGDRNF
ncbi:hypothetical protein TWF481_010642 [Arthrobotrys musiformis]|uniref:Uncharacterized protein n=1 Tax=Arthrobotrys musiformis TaxID=47236 RepID=A0AAV9W1C6_9PEZI